MLDGMASAGVVGVIKHIPGHGRALCDSHVALPVVDASVEELEIDLAPFERLRHAPMAMVAHVVYSAWDPERPASVSTTVVQAIIRERIGFDGWLMSDDIKMEALSGTPGARAAAAVQAGCDVALHCSGEMHEMVSVAEVVPPMSVEGEARLARAMATAYVQPEGPSFAEAVAKRDELLALA
jgi:beta-N-acetylhexosaminidase